MVWRERYGASRGQRGGRTAGGQCVGSSGQRGVKKAGSRCALRASGTAIIVAAVSLSIWPLTATASEPRTALVIGNSSYTQWPALKNPANDARDMGTALRELGFEVEVAVDRNRREMKLAIRRFRDRLKARGGVGLFYFAGHGVELRGQNYLIPVDAEIASEGYVDVEAISAREVMAGLEHARNEMNIVILDACRNNPLPRRSRSGSRGLAVMGAPAETLLAYATSPGEVADDNVSGRNGLYTSKLLQSMQVPGLRLVDVFRRTRREVKRESGGRQVPWQSDNLTSDAFYFIEPTEAPEVNRHYSVNPPGPDAGSSSSSEPEGGGSAERDVATGDWKDLDRIKVDLTTLGRSAAADFEGGESPAIYASAQICYSVNVANDNITHCRIVAKTGTGNTAEDSPGSEGDGKYAVISGRSVSVGSLELDVQRMLDALPRLKAQVAADVRDHYERRYSERTSRERARMVEEKMHAATDKLEDVAPYVQVALIHERPAGFFRGESHFPVGCMVIRLDRVAKIANAGPRAVQMTRKTRNGCKKVLVGHQHYEPFHVARAWGEFHVEAFLDESRDVLARD